VPFVRPGWPKVHQPLILMGWNLALSATAIFRWLAAVGAIVTASSVGYVAHYDLGFSRQEVHTKAVIGVAIIGLLMATEYLGKKLRKPK
jgi:hypothetical protein